MSRSLGASIAGVEQVALDATDAVALQPAVRGADAVIVTVGARAREGETPRTDITRSVIAAIATEGVRRLVVQSSYGVGDSYDSMPFVMKRASLARMSPRSCSLASRRRRHSSRTWPTTQNWPTPVRSGCYRTSSPEASVAEGLR